jgi:hypothetical protein
MCLLCPLHIQKYIFTVCTAHTGLCAYCIHCPYRIMFLLCPLYKQNYILYYLMLWLYPLNIQAHCFTVFSVRTDPSYSFIHSVSNIFIESSADTVPGRYYFHYRNSAMILLIPLYIPTHISTIFTAHDYPCIYCIIYTYRARLLLYPQHTLRDPRYYYIHYMYTVLSIAHGDSSRFVSSLYAISYYYCNHCTLKPCFHCSCTYTAVYLSYPQHKRTHTYTQKYTHSHTITAAVSFIFDKQ